MTAESSFASPLAEGQGWPRRSSEAIRRHAQREVRQPYIEWLSGFLADWWPIEKVVKERGIPRDVLRMLGERGRLRQRTWGRRHRVYYSLAEIDYWLASCPELAAADDVESVAREFIASREHHGDGWASRRKVAQDFRTWCSARLGVLPHGWKAALWRQVKKDGRFRKTWHTLGDRSRVRTLTGW
jgi:hypothetical protein